MADAPSLLDALRDVAAAYARDPAIADRLARELVASSVDAAIAHAATGALFDALGDPSRARTAWQASVDASAEPGFQRGLAEAQARQGDGDAALITATAAAAWSGDPAVVWTAVARALAGAGRHVHALDAARSAIDLASAETLGDALDAAITSSRALGRHDQAARLAAMQATLLTGPAGPRADDPTDAPAALAAGAPARLWTAARWNPRDVAIRAALLAALPADDPQRPSVIAELLALASDPDRERARAAVAALHDHP